MKHFLLLTLFFSISFLGTAKEKFKFGKVDKELLEMSVYELDSSAEAVVILDKGDTRIEYMIDRFLVKFKKTIRIKILDEKGLEWANQAIYYSTKYDKVSGLKAYTHNLENGNIVTTKINKENITNEIYSKYTTVRKFTLPQVKVGSVIEYTYNVSSTSFSIDTWHFQDEIPTIQSEYSFTTPEYLEFKFLPGGFLYPKYNKVNNTDANLGTIYHHEWEMSNVPAYKEEPFIASDKDFITKMDFQLKAYKNSSGVVVKSFQNTWENLAKDLLIDSDFGLYLNKTKRLKDEAILLTANAKNDIEKVNAIYNYVSQTFTWNNKYDFVPSESINTVIDTKTGNTADINLILVGMLQEVGINAEPVIISTRHNGLINPSYPILRRMNSVLAVAYVDGGQVLMNATDPLRTPNLTAINDRSAGQGITVSKTPRWITLKTDVKSMDRTYLQGEISEEGVVSANIMSTKTGYYALNARKKIISKGEMKYIQDELTYDEDEEEDEEVSEAEGDSNELGIVEASINGLNEISKPLITKYHRDFETEGNMGGRIYLPLFLGLGWNSNPFQSETRTYPVDLPYTRTEQISVVLKIPEGYALESIPEPTKIVLPNKAASFLFNVSVNGNTIQVLSKMDLKKSGFMIDEYPLLREFFTQMYNKHQAQLVLVKKAQ